jgi:hypothetical protein
MRTMSGNELALKDAMRKPIPVARFRAPDGSSHTVAVTKVDGGWRILDQNGGEPAVVDTLTHREDGREQAEAVARDYAQWAELPTWARN